MVSFGKKAKTALKFISLLKLEVCILLSMLAFSIRGIPFNQLLQDKICMQNYGNDRKYCRDLAEITVEDDPKGFKIKILKDVTDMGLYFVLILTLPSVFWSLFIGPWMDKYPHARKILIIVYSIGALLEVILYALNAYMFNWGKIILIN